jgi:hypothetical protein
MFVYVLSGLNLSVVPTAIALCRLLNTVLSLRFTDLQGFDMLLCHYATFTSNQQFTFGRLLCSREAPGAKMENSQGGAIDNRRSAEGVRERPKKGK